MINEIKQIPLIDVISYYNVHFNTYSNKICCPFPSHNEKEPSFLLKPEKNTFICYGCQRGGSAIDFVMGMEDVDVYSAIRILADRHNIAVGDSFNQDQKYFDSFASYVLKYQEKALPYLKDRKIPESIANHFSIGYCPDSLPNLPQKYTEFYLDKKILSPKFPKGYNWFLRNRIVVPVKMSSGYYLGFVGRAEDKEEDIRYLNTKFEKNTTLFGWNVAKKYIYKFQSVYLVEGIFDVFAFFAQGIYNVVSTLGTSLSSEQKNLLSNNLDIIVVYDGDSAGQKAILRLAESIEIKKIALPDKEDVASLHENGYDLKKLIGRDSVKDVIEDLKEKDAVSAFKIALQRVVAKEKFLTVRELYSIASTFGVNTDEAYAAYLDLSKGEAQNVKYKERYKFKQRKKYHVNY